MAGGALRALRLSAATVLGLMGLAHLAFGATLFEGLSLSWLWFMSGGLMLMFGAGLNLAAAWNRHRSTGLMALAANIAMAAFAGAFLAAGGAEAGPQGFLLIALLAVLIGLSFAR